ncbi:MAG: CDP-alcohol phosphatidyltransferase family protein [Clostridia bacterium]|nr:CDP-alcohol phosphatidyltransferase family protein [Clostridia bacterium]
MTNPNNVKEPSKVLNLPNILSLIRVFLVPIFVASLIFMRHISVWGIIVPTIIYILTAFTDMLDGQIARRNNLVTEFGKFIDPLADKFMVIGSGIAITLWLVLRAVSAADVILACVYVFVVLVILFRELAVTGLRLAVGGKVDVAASIFGKMKTVSQMVGTVVILVEPLIPFFSENHILSYVMMAIMTLTTIYSGIEYLKAYLPHIDFSK